MHSDSSKESVDSVTVVQKLNAVTDLMITF